MLEVKEITIDSLHPWENNPRLNDQAVEAVSRSIINFGFNVPIICDQNLTIIAGHTRWKAAKTIGLERVPAIIIQMTETQRHAFAIADNKTAEIADWDFPKLKDLLKELRAEDVDIKCIGFSDEEIRRMILCDDDEENQIPEINQQNITTKPGDIYQLGKHRLMCGDSRDKEAVTLLIGEYKIDHVFGGPPYFNQRAYSHWEKYIFYLEDMKKIVVNCYSIIKDGAVVMWNIANGCSSHSDHVSHHSGIFEDAGFTYLDTIIWKKTGANYAIPRNFHIERNSCYYPALEWEALLIYQKPGNIPKMTLEARGYMSKYHTDVWEIPAVTNQMKEYEHPAVCPVEIPFRSILAYSGRDAVIFEPFGGSGTTLIAAEKASRTACLMELSPAYCDAIVKRWEKTTGEKAVLVE